MGGCSLEPPRHGRAALELQGPRLLRRRQETYLDSAATGRTEEPLHSERMVWDTDQRKYLFIDREHINPAFGIRPDRDESAYEEGEKDYDSGSDAEATSSDEDSDGDGCA